jgi:hypothetical protein
MDRHLVGSEPDRMDRALVADEFHEAHAAPGAW